MGYNPDMHFNDNYLTYTGGSTDFLGFDDGSRKNKIANSILGNAFDPRLNQSNSSLNVVNRVSNQFDPQMAPKVSNSGMNFGFGISYGNQLNFKMAMLWEYWLLCPTKMNRPFMKTPKIIFIILALTKTFSLLRKTEFNLELLEDTM